MGSIKTASLQLLIIYTSLLAQYNHSNDQAEQSNNHNERVDSLNR